MREKREKERLRECSQVESENKREDEKKEKKTTHHSKKNEIKGKYVHVVYFIMMLLPLWLLYYACKQKQHKMGREKKNAIHKSCFGRIAIYCVSPFVYQDTIFLSVCFLSRPL